MFMIYLTESILENTISLQEYLFERLLDKEYDLIYDGEIEGLIEEGNEIMFPKNNQSGRCKIYIGQHGKDRMKERKVSEREILDARSYCNQTEYNALFQFDYYKTASNRVKKLGKTGSADFWWERSPSYDGSTYFCYVNSGGAAGRFLASTSYGLAPFGCI